MSLLDDLRAFIGTHQGCGSLVGDAEAPADAGYLLWVACSCGARFERWITPEVAEMDLVFSPLLASRN